ncbi:MAG: hypothetical protein LC104_14235 [Bacteroidales bacterium]|nr:hypothetical protein [Bacteroidales bacterium]
MARRLILPILLVGLMVTLAPAADLDPIVQREQQKRVQAEVQQTARRVMTTLRVLQYQKLDPNAEHKVLDEVATGLRTLGQNDMQAVLRHLEQAVRAPDSITSTAEQRAAYQKHREIVGSLREMLTLLDLLKSLDQAAERFDRAAESEHALHLRSTASAAFGDRRPGGREKVITERDSQADAQSDLRVEVATLIKQLATLRPTLNAEQRTRLDQTNALSRAGRIVAELEFAHRDLRSANFLPAARRQEVATKDLQALAADLRTPRDKVAALREARDAVHKLAEAERALRQDTTAKPKTPTPAKADAAQKQAEKAEHHQLADRQATLEFQTRQARKAIENVAREAAARLIPAESEMRRAEENLRSLKRDAAADPQKNAEKRLAEVLEKIDEQIAATEQQKSDPLAAVQKASEEIAKLMDQQESTKQATEKNKSRPDQLKPAAEQQQAITERAEAIQDLPLPENPAARKALEKATAQSRKAADDLARKDADDALPNQAETQKALAEAKKALDEQAAAIQKRRDQLAKLEAAEKLLDELTQAEKKIAADAQAVADPEAAEKPNPPQAEAVASEQSQLTPPTQDIGKQLQEDVPAAAEKIAEAAQAQKAAKDNLLNKKPMPAAEQATEAAKKLEAAKNDVAQKRNELKAQEIADQAALRPDAVNPAEAAQQIAKAIEQAEKAAKQAAEAAKQLGEPQADEPMAGEPKPGEPMATESPNGKPMAGEPKPGEPQEPEAQQPNAAAELAKLQQEIAKKAESLKAKEAAESAAKAAQALEKGDLAQAIHEQQKAIEQLQEAGEPMDGEPAKGEAKPMNGEPAKGEAKPMDGESPAGPPQPATAQTPAELAGIQKKLKEATQALAEAAQANAAAQAALEQAQSLAPQAVQEQLQQANQQLNQAAQKLTQGQPTPAGQAQKQAAQQLNQALSALNAAAQAMGQPMAQPGQQQQAMAVPPPDQQSDQPMAQSGQEAGKPGQPGQPGQQAGQPKPQPGKPGQSAKKGDSPEKNEGFGEGDREGVAKNGSNDVRGKMKEGNSGFINLQALERDKVQQNAEAAFPAQFRELIKQYNINIKEKATPQSASPKPR